MTSKKTRILIFGTFVNYLREAEGNALMHALQSLLGNYTIAFIDAGGKCLSDYVNAAAKLHAMSVPDRTEAAFIENYRPTPENILKGMGSEKQTALLRYEVQSMMEASTPHLAICIGGGDKRTEAIWDMCEKEEIPLLGTPFYKGYGLDIYNILLEKVQKNDPNYFPYTVGKYGEDFYKALSNMQGNNITAFIQTIKMALTETGIPT